MSDESQPPPPSPATSSQQSRGSGRQPSACLSHSTSLESSSSLDFPPPPPSSSPQQRVCDKMGHGPRAGDHPVQPAVSEKGVRREVAEKLRVVTAPKPQTKYDLRHNRWYGKGMSYVIKKISRKTQKIAVDKYVRQWNVQK